MLLSQVDVHIYPTPFVNESRTLKITGTLAKAGVFDNILIMAVAREDLPERESLDSVREVIRLPRRWGGERSGAIWKALRTVEWSWRTFAALRGTRIACVNCHSLPLLPLCTLLKLWKRCKLVYDTHELETETSGSVGIRKAFGKWMERALIRFTDEVSVVNESIAEWYRREYRLERVWVVKNAPWNSEESVEIRNSLRQKFGIPADALLYLYVGILHPGRGIQALLDVFRHLGPDRHLVFVGFGSQTEQVKQYARDYPNIHYHDPVKPQEVRQYSAQADIGFAFYENNCLNHYFCLPNKVFEYLCAGVPMIVSDFPEMARFVDTYGCGWKVSYDVSALQALIESISREERDQVAAQCRAARSQVGWHFEEVELLKLYSALFGRTYSLEETPTQVAGEPVSAAR
jgi:glycosyltransferase involved in cell wall biosynthesis